MSTSNTRLRFAPAPPQIRPVAEPLAFMRRGADAKSPFPDSLALSLQWAATAAGQPVPVYAVPVTRCGPHSFCCVELAPGNEPAELRLCFSGVLRRASVQPGSDALRWHRKGNELICLLTGPCTFTVEPNGRMYAPLTVFVSSSCPTPPSPEDPNVLWFSPGLHQVSSLELRSGQTVWLEPGAILKAQPPEESEPAILPRDWAGKPNYRDFIHAEDCEDIRILGRGILDLSALDWHARRTLCFTRCRRILVDGPLLVGAAHWTAAFFQCEDVTVRRVGILGYRENSDGIDLVNCLRARVRDCFIRTGDDCVCVKAMEPPPYPGGQDILVEGCTVWSDKVRALGIAGESRGEICRVTFRRCTVLHSLADWAEEVGALCVVLCDAGTAREVLFEQIDVRDERASGINCMLFRDGWSTDAQTGHICGVTFRKIRLPSNVPVRLWGHDEEHKVENILLEHVTSGGQPRLCLDTNRYTEDIRLSP